MAVARGDGFARRAGRLAAAVFADRLATFLFGALRATFFALDVRAAAFRAVVFAARFRVVFFAMCPHASKEALMLALRAPAVISDRRSVGRVQTVVSW
jgi:hypothetical protein